MNRNLQNNLVFLSTIFIAITSFAQNTNNRVNKITNVIPSKEIKENVNTENTTSVKNNNSQSEIETKGKEIKLENSENLRPSNPKKKIEFDIEKSNNRIAEQEAKMKLENNQVVQSENLNIKEAISNSETPINWEENTTAIKVVEPEEYKTINTEYKPQKVTKSVNYTERKIKEDIHPTTQESNKISAFKKTQLEEEAIQIKKIMDDNKTNPEFNKTFYQSKLDKINMLLK